MINQTLGHESLTMPVEKHVLTNLLSLIPEENKLDAVRIIAV